MSRNKCINEECDRKSKLNSFFKGVAVVAGVSIVTVKLLPKISSKLYKESVKKSNRVIKDDDWGPIIERIKK